MAGNATLEIIIKATDEATTTLKSINKTLAANSKEWKDNYGAVADYAKKAGLVMLGMGTAMAAGLGMAVKSAEEERVGIMRLDAQLKNVGTSYDKVKSSLEGVIKATMLKTGVADDEQREALGQLVLATGNYEKALSMLPLALDFAAAKQIDLNTAAELLGKVAQGNTSLLTRYGIVLKEGATAVEALAIIQGKVAGTAQAMVSPMKVFSNLVKDLSENIGAVLLPKVSGFVEKLNGVLVGLQNTNPELINFAVNAAAVSAAVLILGGGFLTLIGQLLKLIASFQALNMLLPVLLGLLGSPLGIAGVAVAAAVAIGGLSWYMSELNKKAIELNPNLKATSDHITAIGTQTTITGQTIQPFNAELQQQSQALLGVNNAAKETTTSIVQLTEAEEAAKRATKQTNDAFSGLLDQIMFTGTEADKFNITARDVYDVLLEQGWTVEQLRSLWDKYGEGIGNVNALLDAMGLTAEEVSRKLRGTSEAVASVGRAGRAASGGGGGGGGMMTRPADMTDQEWEEYLRTGNTSSYQYRKQNQNAREVQATEAGKRGMTIDQYLKWLESQPQGVGSEASLSGGVIVNVAGPNFLDNEESLNKLARKINESIRQGQRLQFGNAYSGA